MDRTVAPFDTKKCLGVLTSGGDSQGMNAALRAVVRMAIFRGFRPFLIYEGYQGLVDGENIKECSWTSLSYIMHQGGTVIGTARCQQFRERDGRLKAAENLIKRGINNLAVIGGDGSLTGADVFKKEWKDLTAELVKTNRVTLEQAKQCEYLNVVGLVGSIDNDMCGTDMTIGADSALHRIMEAMDCITSTASSHQRSFVMEVMGRNCGYLALMAAIAGGADWVLIPENPPRPGWEDSMCRKLRRCRERGQRLNLVMVSEGAVDTNNQPITAAYVKSIIDKTLCYDTRITVLGHVQRGGKPSAYDRILATRMGAAASLTLANAEGEIPPVMIGIQGNEIVETPLMKSVNHTRKINQAMKELQFQLALELRGKSFANSMRVLKKLQTCMSDDCHEKTPSTEDMAATYRLAVMNVGAPAGGVNSATRAFVRLLIYSGHTVFGISNGFEGFLKGGSIHEMTWLEVTDWGCEGGSTLGMNRTKPTEEMLPVIAEKLASFQIQGLLVIGGFEAFESLITLEKARKSYPSLCIPIIQLAATISNNVPGTEYSLGCDTALNSLVQSCDILKQSANASRKRVFVVETMGGYCGYLATMGALASGADNAYIFEEPFTLSDLQKDVAHLQKKMVGGLERGLILRNESCNDNYSTEFITRMLAGESQGMYVTRSQILGHLQQGDRPSPFDRILGTKYASAASAHLLRQIKSHIDSNGKLLADTPDTVCVLGLIGLEYVCSPVTTLSQHTDFKHRIAHEQWWMQLRPLIRMLARHHETEFTGEVHRGTWEGAQGVVSPTDFRPINGVEK